MTGDRLQNRWGVRASVGGLLAVLCFLAGFSVITQSRAGALSKRADTANGLSSIYQAARFWVGQEESLERKYRLEPGTTVLRLHDAAEQNLTSDLRSLLRADPSSANRSTVRRLLNLNTRYVVASDGLFAAVDAHKPALALHFDHAIIDPGFGALQDTVNHNAEVASRRSLEQTASLRRFDSSATRAIVIAFVFGVVLLLGLGLVLEYCRRRLNRSRDAELKRLSEVAVTDPLTGLRNYRAFQDDLSRSLHRVGGSGGPVSLVILDFDKLKLVNDTLGHQAGDEHLKTLADALGRAERGSDCAYRIGGDEFAVILNETRAWDALGFTERLRALLCAETQEVRVSTSAGISEKREFADRATLVREAGLALLAAKRSGQETIIYTPDLEPRGAESNLSGDEQHTRTLARALARAVDAKDSYTRSHSQTVSQISGLIAAELGFDAAQIAQMRLAGLLHDVGKIGVPDTILNKPAKLADDEYDEMKTHALLGYDIVVAADMPTEAQWIRHHHERYDGHGYPDRIAGENIPLESRIIFVADSYEAMTSDRPYRKALGQQFAINQLREHAGTQFDPQVVAALCRILKEPAEHALPERPHASNRQIAMN